MTGKQHVYRVSVEWVGNRGSGTSNYTSYDRAHKISHDRKLSIAGSSDPAFRGDPEKWNPEDLFVASASACHMLWYLHLCAINEIVVVEYIDEPEGMMIERPDGSGAFTRIVLRPHAKIRTGSDVSKATKLHHEAHKMCFIANSIRCEIATEPIVTTFCPA
jgi:organic hydroperoxide reductase OsmC/OhrA